MVLDGLNTAAVAFMIPLVFPPDRLGILNIGVRSDTTERLRDEAFAAVALAWLLLYWWEACHFG